MDQSLPEADTEAAMESAATSGEKISQGGGSKFRAGTDSSSPRIRAAALVGATSGAATKGNMVQLPPELDRLCYVPPRGTHRMQTQGLASTSTHSLPDGRDDPATVDANAVGGDGGGEDEERLASALAQVAELDSLLERQVECERFARFDRLLYAQENGLQLSDKEVTELEKLRTHVMSADPEFASTVFKTQPANFDPTKAAGKTQSETTLGDSASAATGSTASFTLEHDESTNHSGPANGDTPNFIKRNIELVTEANIRLTDAEQVRLEELLAVEDDDDTGSDTELELLSGATATTDGDDGMMPTESKESLPVRLLPKPLAELEVNRLVDQPPRGNAFKLTAAQKRRLEVIDSHLQHLSTERLMLTGSQSTSSSASGNGHCDHSATASSAEEPASSLHLLSDPMSDDYENDTGDAMENRQPRLTPQQLELLLEQCREEQSLRSSSALSEARHAMYAVDRSRTLVIQEYDGEAECDREADDSREMLSYGS